ncbi:MAG: type II toxin-antitoxin system HicB family antitoxin [Candidatus Brocadiales bacterium]|nr:type II toxin-antitoxin system HicB family antitoxin [Candidatus Brocadiales bacterium]
MTAKRKEKITYKSKEYTILVEPDLEDGGYVVECLDIPGCLSQGDTRDSAIENIKDAIRECQAVLRKKERAVKAHHG